MRNTITSPKISKTIKSHVIFIKEREQFNNKFVNKLIGKDSQSLLSLTFSIYRTISSIVIVRKTPTINLVISLIYYCFLID